MDPRRIRNHAKKVKRHNHIVGRKVKPLIATRILVNYLKIEKYFSMFGPGAFVWIEDSYYGNSLTNYVRKLVFSPSC